MQSSHADAGEPSAVSGLAAGVGVSLAAATPTAASADNNNDDSGGGAGRVVNGGPIVVDPVSDEILVGCLDFGQRFSQVRIEKCIS